jgi:O-antigen/teichoic acid export membrane protein
LVIIGLLVHLIPLAPGALIIVIGLEFLGVRLLVQNKLKKYFKNSKFFKKKLTKHDKK